jgi:hypothetical protein
VCDLCGASYYTKEAAEECESVPVREDKGVSVGDIVLVTKGDGQGQEAQVKRTLVLDKDWGHYRANYYHHTVAVEADLIGSWGTRLLTCDNYDRLR